MKRRNIDALVLVITPLFLGLHAFLPASLTSCRIPSRQRASEDGKNEDLPFFLKNNPPEEEEEPIETLVTAPELFVDDVLYHATELAREVRNIDWEEVKANVDALTRSEKVQTFKDTTVRTSVVFIVL